MKKIITLFPLALTLLISAAHAGCTQSRVPMNVDEESITVQQPTAAFQQPQQTPSVQPHNNVSDNKVSELSSQRQQARPQTQQSQQQSEQQSSPLQAQYSPQSASKATSTQLSSSANLPARQIPINPGPDQRPLAMHTCPQIFMYIQQNIAIPNPSASAATAQQLLTAEDMSDIYESAMTFYKNKHYHDAQRLLQIVAQNGHVHAQYFLGKIAIYPGWHGKSNHAEAFAWIFKAANNGLLEAEELLANMYHNGIGTEHDDKQAQVWYKHAANRGSAKAQFMVSCMYQKSNDPKEKALAEKWLIKSAEAGFPEAQHCLGTHYESKAIMSTIRNGTPQNFGHQAVTWHARAADQGLVDSQCALGHHYEDGICTQQDLKKAATLFTQAAQSGNPYALRDCGLFFAHQGDEKNAEHYLTQASKHKNCFNSRSQRVIDTFVNHDECSICRDEIHVGDASKPLVQTSCCNNLFHRDCLSPWLHRQNTCPLCKAKSPRIIHHALIQ